MRMRAILTMLSACVLLACSQSPDDETLEAGSEPLPYHGETSLEERIANYPTIVKGTLDRVTSEVVAAGSYGTGKYVIAVKFHLTVSEYLNGTGTANITAVWGSEDLHDTHSDAEGAIPSLLAQRDTSFDDREAVFFLTSDFWELFAELKAENVYFTDYAGEYSDDLFISLNNRHNKLWLPVVEGETGTGDSQEFLLALPEPATAQTTSNVPTITLGALKSKIATVNAVLNGGDGSEAYKECVRRKYRAERSTSHSRSQGWEHPRVRNSSHSFTSGAPAGTAIYEVEARGYYPDQKFNRTWLDDGDAALFEMVDGPTTPREFDYDGVLTAGVDYIAYTQSLKSKRPLPPGEYTFNIKDEALGPITKLCNDVSAHEWAVTVTSTSGALHELLFDPVTVGSTVAADATNGVLKPTAFTDSNGASATIASLGWESGTVKLEVDPHTVLTGHVVDFIKLDATVSLSLDVSNATADAANDTLSWSVASQPWEDGDKLMVRIREAPPSCSNSGVVPDARSEPALAGDCETLLGLRDALAGTGSLNWGLDTAITSWDGVTVGGTPRRVTRLDLVSGRLTGVVPLELSKLTGLEYLQLGFNRLTGGIPVELGSMVNLRFLELSGNRLTGPVPLELSNLSNLNGLWLNTNRLTGPIPPELGDLSNLEGLGLSRNMLTGGIPVELGNLTELGELRLYENQLTGTIPSVLRRLTNLWLLQLAGNSLVGCLPPELRSITINDFGRLGLPDCAEGLVAAPDDLMVSLADGTFSMTWTAVSGADRYEVQRRIAGSGDDWAALPATESVSASFTPEGGLVCGTTYEFRARSHGDGLTHVTEWGEESAPVSVTTEMCNRDPSFDPASYTFSVSEDAETDDGVGSVSATDPDEGDAVTYAITQGNTGGAFAVNGSTGEITVAGTLDHETDSSHTLTVQASDGRGGTATTTVEITVTDVAEDPPPAPQGLSVSLADGAFTISWTALAGAARYEVQHREEGSGDDWTVVGSSTSGSLTFTPEDAPDCGTTHEFRMRAFGDGETYVATWGAESASESVATEECDRAPRFGSTHYSFSIAEDAATSTSVGTVSATDEDGDTLTYEIAVGNEDGKFSIGSSTGGITLAGEVDSDVLAFYSLRVEADDGNGNTATTTVGVSLLLSECSNGTVVPRPRSNPHLVRDCSMLLAGRDTLAGTGSLDWSANTRINDWQGVTVHPTPSPYVRVLLLTEQGLTGSIPPELGGVADVRRIDLDYNTLTGAIPRELGSLPDLELLYMDNNQLTGPIPPEMGNLRNLKTLYLSDNNLTGALPSELGRLRRLTQLTIEDNSLTGAIPPELGDLSNLRSLYLSANMLTGGIPPELGKLSKLTQLLLERNSLGGEIPSQLGSLTRLEHVYLRNNGLTGAIPAEWGELANLTRLYLSSGNNLTGCIPSGLRDVEDNDLDRLGLEYCGSSGQ